MKGSQNNFSILLVRETLSISLECLRSNNLNVSPETNMICGYLPVLSQRRGKLLLSVGLVSPGAVSLARFGSGVVVRFAIVAAGHEARGVVENAVLGAHHVPRVLHLTLQVVVEGFESSKEDAWLHVLPSKLYFALTNFLISALFLFRSRSFRLTRFYYHKYDIKVQQNDSLVV